MHPATASRALSPATRALVNSTTAERVDRAAAELGYRPNPIARSLKTARSGSIGVIIPDLTNPLFPPIVRGVEDTLVEAGYTAYLANTDNDPSWETRHVESMVARQVEGLIVATARLRHPLLESLAAEGPPLVLVNRRLADDSVCSVTADDAAGVAMAMRHLADLGHTRVAHVAGPADTTTGTTRAQAYREAVRALGLRDDPALVVAAEAWSESEGRRALGELLDSGADLTAVLVGNDLLAMGCYDALRERGLTCPSDVSVVGFNDLPFAHRLDPPLTTVAIPKHEIGVHAARLLLEVLQEPGLPARSVVLPVRLMVRRSTVPPSASQTTRTGGGGGI